MHFKNYWRELDAMQKRLDAQTVGEGATPREILLSRLRSLQLEPDSEIGHIAADDALLVYIDDPEISEAFTAIKRWYV